MTNSRQKGSRGERDLAGEITKIFGVEARRSQQYCGAAGDADLITGLKGIHVECKRVERLSLYKAMHQAIDDVPLGEIPVVMHRKNLEPWLCIVRLDDVPKFARRILLSMDELHPDAVDAVYLEMGQNE